jgi:hypothetical protein
MTIASITSNEGALDSASAVLEVTTNPAYNQPALRIKQASGHGGAASIRIDDPNPTSNLSRLIRWLPRGNTKLQFSRTSSRSMAVTRMTLASRPLSCFSGGRRWQHRFRGHQPIWSRTGRNRDC